MEKKLVLIRFPGDNCKSKTELQLITNTRISTHSRAPLAPRKVFEKPHEEAKQILQSDLSFNTSVAEDYSSTTSFAKFILALSRATLSGDFYVQNKLRMRLLLTKYIKKLIQYGRGTCSPGSCMGKQVFFPLEV